MEKVYYEELKSLFNDEGYNVIMKNYRGKIDENDIFYVFARALIIDSMKDSNEILRNNKSIDILFERIDSRYNDIICDIRDKFDEKKLKSIILNFNNKLIGNLYIYEDIINLVNSLLEIKEEDKILQPYSREGEFITHHLVNFPNNTITGIDVIEENILISQIKASIVSEKIEKVKFIQSDYLNAELDDVDYNKIFSIPPFGINSKSLQNTIQNKKLIDYYTKNDLGLFTDWVYLIKEILNPNFERGIYITTSNILFNKKDAKIRKHLMEKGLIEGIIELPSRMFISTSITVNIVVLSKGNKTVKMVDASNIYKKERERNIIDKKGIKMILDSYYLNNENSKVVSSEEFEETEYNLLPKRYINKKLDLKNYIYLKDVAEIKRGYTNIKQEELNKRLLNIETNNKLMIVGDINDEFNIGSLNNLEYIKDNEKVYCIENEQIAISRGGNYKSILIRKKDETILTNGMIYIINCDKEKMNPYYLQMYLSSEHCLNQIKSLNVGSVISFISISQLGDLKIPKVSKKLENELSEKYKQILNEYENIRLKKNKLKDETKKMINKII